MKTKLQRQDTFSRDRGIHFRYIVEVPEEAANLLGWNAGDELHIDIPITGPGLVVYRDSDPIVLMGGVKEKVNV